MAITALLASLGTPEFETCSKRARDSDAAKALLRAIGEEGTQLGPPDANGRSVFEDLEAHLYVLARAYPRLLLDSANEWPALKKSFAFVSALSEIADANDLLLELLGAKLGFIRWLAFRELVRRDDSRVAAALPKALKDRDGLVVFDAAEAAARLGEATLLPRLREIAASEKTPPGTKNAAETAIAAIEARENALQR
jgi:hypothetical protein